MPLAYQVKPGFDLGKVDLARRLDDEESYQRQLRKLQVAMLQLQQIFRVEGRRGIIVLEGWDAAGKDGAIRRMTEKLDLRWLRVCPIGKPTAEEQGRHFLWRFWQLLPPPGHLAIFDRSWYGRGSGRTGRGLCHERRMAARLRRNQRFREAARR